MRGPWTLALLCLMALTAARDLDMSTKNNWRCGIFIPGYRKYRDPLTKFFVLQTLHRATCQPVGRPDTRSIRKGCSQLGAQWENSFNQFDTLWKPFIAQVPGDKRPVDACTIIEAELGLRNVPGENEKKYRDGIELGYFYNYCGGRRWRDTGRRSKRKVCCQDGVSKDCQLLLKEIEERKAEAAEALTSTTTTTTTTTTTKATTTTPTTTIRTPTISDMKGAAHSAGAKQGGTDRDGSGGQGGGGSQGQAHQDAVSPAVLAIDNLLTALNNNILTKAEVSAVKVVLKGLKLRAEEITQRISVLEEVLESQGQLEKAEMETAASMISLANCIQIRVDLPAQVTVDLKS